MDMLAWFAEDRRELPARQPRCWARGSSPGEERGFHCGAGTAIHVGDQDLGGSRKSD